MLNAFSDPLFSKWRVLICKLPLIIYAYKLSYRIPPRLKTGEVHMLVTVDYQE